MGRRSRSSGLEVGRPRDCLPVNAVASGKARRMPAMDEKQVCEPIVTSAAKSTSHFGNAALFQMLAGNSGVREVAHLAHRVTP
jgi:hypothetical protein